MIEKNILVELYHNKKKSMQEIAEILGCSLHKVSYWMERRKLKKRKLSDAMYIKHNPDGDPFKFVFPTDSKNAQLFGLGLGLYWGEGTKANLNSVRLGNTDPRLIKRFIEFLIKFFQIKKGDLKFGLQIFSDINPRKAMDFWSKILKINKTQFNKPIVTKSGSIGTYRKKSDYGVLTVMYHNKKLRDLLVSLLPL